MAAGDQSIDLIVGYHYTTEPASTLVLFKEKSRTNGFFLAYKSVQSHPSCLSLFFVENAVDLLHDIIETEIGLDDVPLNTERYGIAHLFHIHKL